MSQPTGGGRTLCLTRLLTQTRVLQRLEEDVLLELSRPSLRERQQTPTPASPDVGVLRPALAERLGAVLPGQRHAALWGTHAMKNKQQEFQN